jgi:hypothetical protein
MVVQVICDEAADEEVRMIVVLQSAQPNVSSAVSKPRRHLHFSGKICSPHRVESCTCCMRRLTSSLLLDFAAATRRSGVRSFSRKLSLEPCRHAEAGEILCVEAWWRCSSFVGGCQPSGRPLQCHDIQLDNSQADHLIDQDGRQLWAIV